MQARRSAAQPQPQIRSRRGEQEVDRIALDAPQEVAAEPEVAFEMTDAWFDGRTATEACPHLALGVVGGFGGRLVGQEQLGRAILLAATVAAVGDGFLGPVAGNTLDLGQRGLDGVPVVGVLFEIERAEDDAVVLADGQRGLGPELILLVARLSPAV